MRFHPFVGIEDLNALFNERSKVEFFPDEYGYLYEYQIGIVFTTRRTVPDEFEYLGNFNVSKPKDEYVPFSEINIDTVYWKSFFDKVEKSYNDYNLGNSDIYNEECCRKIHQLAKDDFEFSCNLNNNYVFNKFRTEPNCIYNNFGFKLYDNDVTLDVKDYYKTIKPNNKSSEEIVQLIYDKFSDFMSAEDDKSLVIMALADRLITDKKLTSEVKLLALDAIESDLKHWENSELYNKRKKELGKLKKKLEEYHI